jgi:thiamine biosynthesis lipoprotein
VERARPALGTLVAVRVGDAPDQALAIEAAFVAVARVERLMGCHQPDTELSRLNGTAHVHAQAVDPWTFRVFRLALALWRRSAGAFDCTIGARHVAAGRLPSHGHEVAATAGSSADIELPEPNRIRFRRKLYVDLGGIAKGFAVDCAVAAMRRAGAASGVVNAGGDLRVFGAIAEPVHLRLPTGLVCLGEIRDAAVATSSTEDSPTPGLAILDARSGRRARANVISVFAGRCVLADALTKIVATRGARSGRLLAQYGAEAICWNPANSEWTRVGASAA